MNPFEINYDDVSHLFDVASEEVLIEGKPRKAIITHYDLLIGNIIEDRKLHTLDKVEMGDEVFYRDEPYLIVSQVVSPRHAKYVSVIRNCNHVFTFEEVVGQEFSHYVFGK